MSLRPSESIKNRLARKRNLEDKLGKEAVKTMIKEASQGSFYHCRPDAEERRQYHAENDLVHGLPPSEDVIQAIKSKKRYDLVQKGQKDEWASKSEMRRFNWLQAQSKNEHSISQIYAKGAQEYKNPKEWPFRKFDQTKQVYGNMTVSGQLMLTSGQRAKIKEKDNKEAIMGSMISYRINDFKKSLRARELKHEFQPFHQQKTEIDRIRNDTAKIPIVQLEPIDHIKVKEFHKFKVDKEKWISKDFERMGPRKGAPGWKQPEHITKDEPHNVVYRHVSEFGRLRDKSREIGPFHVALKTHYKVDDKLATMLQKDSKFYAGTLSQLSRDIVVDTLSSNRESQNWDQQFNRTRNFHKTQIKSLSRSVQPKNALTTAKKAPFPSPSQSTYDMAINEMGNNLTNFKHQGGMLNQSASFLSSNQVSAANLSVSMSTSSMQDESLDELGMPVIPRQLKTIQVARYQPQQSQRPGGISSALEKQLSKSHFKKQPAAKKRNSLEKTKHYFKSVQQYMRRTAGQADSLDTNRLRNEVTAMIVDNENWPDDQGEEDIVVMCDLPIQNINELSMESLPKYSPKPEQRSQTQLMQSYDSGSSKPSGKHRTEEKKRLTRDNVSTTSITIYDGALPGVQEDARENLESRGAQKRAINNQKMRIYSNASQRADPKLFIGAPIPGANNTVQNANFRMGSNSVRNKGMDYLPINRFGKIPDQSSTQDASGISAGQRSPHHMSTVSILKKDISCQLIDAGLDMNQAARNTQIDSTSMFKNPSMAKEINAMSRTSLVTLRNKASSPYRGKNLLSSQQTSMVSLRGVSNSPSKPMLAGKDRDSAQNDWREQQAQEKKQVKALVTQYFKQ